MSDAPVPKPPAANRAMPDSFASSGMLGVLRSWLTSGSTETWEPSEALSGEGGGRSAHCYGSARVLVVDDNPVNLMLMSALLESRGLTPVLAADGAQAVALACERPFDLILMDLQMPVLDGLEATTAIRHFESNRSRPSVPVLAFSSTKPGAGVLAKHGLNGSLSKPCEDHELEDCLVQWCAPYRPRPAPTVPGAGGETAAWRSACPAPGTGIGSGISNGSTR